MQTMTLIIKHIKNPDIFGGGGYWSKMDRPNNVRIPVETIEEAAEKCRDFIEEYDLGSGNWVGGVVTEGDNPVAAISFNGRIWGKDDEYLKHTVTAVFGK